MRFLSPSLCSSPPTQLLSALLLSQDLYRNKQQEAASLQVLLMKTQASTSSSQCMFYACVCICMCVCMCEVTQIYISYPKRLTKYKMTVRKIDPEDLSVTK